MTDKGGSWRGGGDLSRGIHWINSKILQMPSTSDVRLWGNTFFPEEYWQSWRHFPNICHLLPLAPIHCLERPNWLHCFSGCLFGSCLKCYRCRPTIQTGIWLLWSQYIWLHTLSKSFLKRTWLLKSTQYKIYKSVKVLWPSTFGFGCSCNRKSPFTDCHLKAAYLAILLHRSIWASNWRCSSWHCSLLMLHITARILFRPHGQRFICSVFCWFATNCDLLARS